MDNEINGLEDLNYIETIETLITSLEEEGTAMVSHSREGHLWKFQYGSIEVFVQLTGLDEENTLTVWSIVLKQPFKHELELLRKLMDLNWAETLEARFALLEGHIVVMTTRNVADLSATEISRAITIVANLANDYDEPLAQEFGTT